MTLRYRLASWLLRGSGYCVTSTDSLEEIAAVSFQAGVSCGEAMATLEAWPEPLEWRARPETRH